jgi:RND family efflux transporter MFP subunit
MRAMTLLLPMAALMLAACGADEPERVAEAAAASVAGERFTVHMAMRPSLLEATGVAAPWAESTLSTKLMGTVLEVGVQAGDNVRTGAVLVRIDARDLEAKSAQAAASLAQADAMLGEARLHAERMRTLYAQEAATRAQLDAAETGLARAEAAVAAARAGGAELDAVRTYAIVRAPFGGTITGRFVDPGAFAAPGAPLVTIQDASRLRISASIAPAAARELSRGDTVWASIEGIRAQAVIEGVVPAPGANVYTVNAVVDNAAGLHLPGSAATLSLPQGMRESLVIPVSALVREGDLTGVRIEVDGGTELRWVRAGAIQADSVEVLSGLRDGERVVVPSAPVTES